MRYVLSSRSTKCDRCTRTALSVRNSSYWEAPRRSGTLIQSTLVAVINAGRQPNIPDSIRRSSLI